MVVSTVRFTVKPENVDGRPDFVETPRRVNVVVPGRDWSRTGQLDIPAGC